MPSYVAGGVFNNENFPGSLQTQVTGINDNGLTVGFWVDANGNNFGFVDNNGAFTNVVNPLSKAAVTLTEQLLAVNDGNVAAGFYVDANGNSQAFTYNINTAKFSPGQYRGNIHHGGGHQQRGRRGRVLQQWQGHGRLYPERRQAGFLAIPQCKLHPSAGLEQYRPGGWCIH